MALVTTTSEFAPPKRKVVEDVFNPSGIHPVEFKCLVKPYEIEETDDVIKSAKEAGVIVAAPELEREQMAQVIALLVDVGGNAFEDWNGRKPQPGDRVLMAKYAGLAAKGFDGRKYRICNDKDIAGVLFVPDDETLEKASKLGALEEETPGEDSGD